MSWFKLQSLIVPIIRHQFKELGPAFTTFATEEIFGTEKLSRTGIPSYVSSYFPPFPSRAFKRLIRALESQKKGMPMPEMVNIALTTACPYNCWHCSTRHQSGEKMSTSEVISVVEQFLELGCYHFGLTGGEPLLRDDLAEIVASIKHRAVCLLYSTGFGLTEARARTLKKAGLTAFEISLDHSRPERHDELRQYKGSFKRAMDAIQLSQCAGLLTCVTTVATPDRIETGELESFCLMLKRCGVEEITIFEPAAIGELVGHSEVFLDEEHRQKLVQFHQQANNDRRFPRIVSLSFVESCQRMGCQAGHTRFYVTSGGDLTPCDFTPLSFGNVRDEPVRDLVSAMQACFRQPGPVCFLRQNYDLIAQYGWEQIPLPPATSREICSDRVYGERPLFLRKLTE